MCILYILPKLFHTKGRDFDKSRRGKGVCSLTRVKDKLYIVTRV
jgi:hypothetical protein